MMRRLAGQRTVYRGMLAVCLGMLSACANVGSEENWLEALPPRDYFVDQYERDAANHQFQTRQEYLSWIVRFYEGSIFVPQGWNGLTRSLLYDLPESDARVVACKRRELGRLIAAEWAKDNRVRLINTRMLSLWGSIMQQDTRPQFRLAAIDQILGDVRAILQGELAPVAVARSRYAQKLGVPLEDEWDF